MLEGIREINVGKGIDLARAEAVLHAEVLDDMKDQLLICLLKKLANEQGRVSISVAELDATGRYVVAFSVVNGYFDFIVSKKD